MKSQFVLGYGYNYIIPSGFNLDGNKAKPNMKGWDYCKMKDELTSNHLTVITSSDIEGSLQSANELQMWIFFSQNMGQLLKFFTK